MKKMKTFQPKIVIFTAVKNRCMLHWRVFVMELQNKCRLRTVSNKLIGSHVKSFSLLDSHVVLGWFQSRKHDVILSDILKTRLEMQINSEISATLTRLLMIEN